MSDLDGMRPDRDLREERERLDDRQARERSLRDLWWLIVKDGKQMERTGHGAAVRWARAGLGLDEPLLEGAVA